MDAVLLTIEALALDRRRDSQAPHVRIVHVVAPPEALVDYRGDQGLHDRLIGDLVRRAEEDHRAWAKAHDLDAPLQTRVGPIVPTIRSCRDAVGVEVDACARWWLDLVLGDRRPGRSSVGARPHGACDGPHGVDGGGHPSLLRSRLVASGDP